MRKEEEIEALTELGLTSLQAKVYLALVSLGETTAGMTADFSKIARQEVYRIIDELSEVGLVSKLLTSPIRFKSLPFDEGISILLERQMEKTDKLKKKIGKLLEKKHKKRKDQHYTNCRFEILPRQAPWSRNDDLRLGSFKKFDLMTSFKRFSSRIIYDQDVFMKAAKKGTIIRILISKPPHNSPIIPIINNLGGQPNFEIRILRGSFNIVLMVMDQKEAAIALTPKNGVGPPYLVSNHPSFVIMAQQYFEMKWEEAIEI